MITIEVLFPSGATATLQWPAVPRVGDIVILNSAEWIVAEPPCWSEGSEWDETACRVSLTVKHAVGLDDVEPEPEGGSFDVY